jgi:excisionase family DNA binding protein
MATQLQRFGPVTPSDADRVLAAESIQRLEPLVRDSHQLTVLVQADNGPAERLVLPAPAVQLLAGILAEFARGHTMTAYQIPTELTTQEAADLLNVSRPHLISLLDRHEIPYHKVGTHRRIALSDLLEYNRKSQARRDAALAELGELGQGLNSDE